VVASSGPGRSQAVPPFPPWLISLTPPTRTTHNTLDIPTTVVRSKDPTDGLTTQVRSPPGNPTGAGALPEPTFSPKRCTPPNKPRLAFDLALVALRGPGAGRSPG